MMMMRRKTWWNLVSVHRDRDGTQKKKDLLRILHTNSIL